MTCHSANSAHFVRTPVCDVAPKCRSGFSSPTPPTDQSTTASAATRLTARHTHFSDRARTTLLPCAAPDADFTVHGKRRGDCLQLRCRQTLPALPLWQIKARRFVLSEDCSKTVPTCAFASDTAAAIESRCCSKASTCRERVGSARPNSLRLQLVSRTAVGLVTGEPRGGDVFTSRLS